MKLVTLLTAFLAGLLCAVRLRGHRTRRELTAVGPAYRCADCGRAMESEMGDPEYVSGIRRAGL